MKNNEENNVVKKQKNYRLAEQILFAMDELPDEYISAADPTPHPDKN